MAKNLYAYQVARIRAKELSLLDTAAMEQLISAKTPEDCLSILSGKGWAVEEGELRMFQQEQEKTWSLMRELTGDPHVLDVFLLKNDYHNLKAAVKLRYTGAEFPDAYLPEGTVPLAVIQSAAEKSEWGLLPAHMQAPAEEAFQALLHTRDGQLCDLILDSACLSAIHRAGKASDNALIREYAELTVAAADIKIAVRACRTQKPLSLIQRAMAPCDTLDVPRLGHAAAQSEDAVFEYLQSSPYSDAVEPLRESPSAFECWCDNLVIRRIRPQLLNPYTLGPLAAYLAARETELKSVRILLSGKRNGLSDEAVRGRIRETYVV